MHVLKTLIGLIPVSRVSALGTMGPPRHVPCGAGWAVAQESLTTWPMSLPRAGCQQRDLASPLTLLRGPSRPTQALEPIHLVTATSPGALSPPSALDTPGSGPGTRRGPALPYYVIWSRFPSRRRSFPRLPAACHQLVFSPRVRSSSDRGASVIVWAAQVCATGLKLPL